MIRRSAIVAQVVGRAMRIVLGHLGHQDPGDEMDTITASEDAFVDHPFVLLQRQPVGRRGHPLRAHGRCRRCDRGHRWLPPRGRPEPATRDDSIIHRRLADGPGQGRRRPPPEPAPLDRPPKLGRATARGGERDEGSGDGPPAARRIRVGPGSCRRPSDRRQPLQSRRSSTVRSSSRSSGPPLGTILPMGSRTAAAASASRVFPGVALGVLISPSSRGLLSDQY